MITCPNCGECAKGDIAVYSEILRKQDFDMSPVLPTCAHCGEEVEITHRCDGGSVIVLNGTCGSGKSTIAEILLRKGFLAIDGDCVIQVVKHKKGTRQVDFSEIATEIASEIDILSMFGDDFVLSTVILPEDLDKIEARMREIIQADVPFVYREVSADEARKQFADQPYKREIIERVLAEKAEIPVVRGDMPDTWIHGPMCNPDGVILARDTIPAATTAESIHTLLKADRIETPDIADELARAHENFMLYFEHTWGGAMYWIGKYGRPQDGIGVSTNWAYGSEWQKNLDAGMFKRTLESWEEHTDYARNAHKAAAGILRGQLESLSKHVSGSGSRTCSARRWRRRVRPNRPRGATRRTSAASGRP